MGIVIDSNILIRLERGKLDLNDFIKSRESEECFLSVITASELLHGVHRATTAAIRSRRLSFVEAILTQFPILPITVAIARIHAELSATLEKSGQKIGAHDLWIAATCLAHGHHLATGNTAEFARVPGLGLEAV